MSSWWAKQECRWDYVLNREMDRDDKRRMWQTNSGHLVTWTRCEHETCINTCQPWFNVVGPVEIGLGMGEREEIICAHETKTICTGISLQSYTMDQRFSMLNARRNLSRKGIIVVPGIIDRDYCGPIFCTLTNVTDATVRLEGICSYYFQLIFMDGEIVEGVPRLDLQRGSGGASTSGTTNIQYILK